MVAFAVSPRAVISSTSASRRRRAIVAFATIGAGAAIVRGALGVGLVLSRGRASMVHQDRVFEAMVAAPIIAIEAEAAPLAVVVAPAAPHRPRRPRPTAVATLPAKAPPVVATPRVVAALPNEAMPPPFAVVH